jgi:cytochrome c oxidase cbb3-type subunit IV
MYKNILQSIDNVAIWPMISFSIFFIFFLVLLWYVFTVDKNFIRKMKNMPLDKASDTPDSSTTSTQNL